MDKEDSKDLREIVETKLRDAMTPGFVAEFDPDEADFAGAFVEDSMTEVDAFESAFDIDDVEDSAIGRTSSGV